MCTMGGGPFCAAFSSCDFSDFLPSSSASRAVGCLFRTRCTHDGVFIARFRLCVGRASGLHCWVSAPSSLPILSHLFYSFYVLYRLFRWQINRTDARSSPPRLGFSLSRPPVSRFSLFRPYVSQHSSLPPIVHPWSMSLFEVGRCFLFAQARARANLLSSLANVAIFRLFHFSYA